MVIVHLKISLSKKKVKDFLETMDFLHGQIWSYPECVGCNVYKDTRHENMFLVVEEWETSEALARYIRSNVYRSMFSVMELSTEIPEIRYSFVENEKGIDLIEELRR